MKTETLVALCVYCGSKRPYVPGSRCACRPKTVTIRGVCAYCRLKPTATARCLHPVSTTWTRRGWRRRSAA